MSRGYGPEAEIQKAVIARLALVRPEAHALIFHIPNEGRRSPRTGKHLKDMGMMPGVSDLFLPMARCGFHGMWIEVKAPKKKPTPNQNVWMAAMITQGYHAVWGDGVDEICTHILAYVDEELDEEEA